MNISERLFLILPESYRNSIETKATAADVQGFRKLTLNVGLIAVLLVAAIIYFVPASVNVKIGAFIFFSTPVFLMTPYIVLSSLEDRRRTEIEEKLPDALHLVSTALKSGSSINRAFLASARDEFGPLQKELNKTAVQISGGVAVEEALENMRTRVNSPLFKDTLKILTNAISAGGNTADLLESSASDIRASLELRDKVRSSVRMYTIFIFIAGVAAAPVLFGITTYMAETTTSMWSEVGIEGGEGFGGGGGAGITFQQPDINTNFLTQFSILALTISNFFASLIISQIGKGNLRGGAKIAPITITVSVGLFLLVRAGITAIM